MQKPSWKIRRRVIVATLIFCAGEIAYLTVWPESTSLRETIATGLIMLAASVIGAYVFGATWDDKNFMSLNKGRSRDGQAPEGGGE